MNQPMPSELVIVRKRGNAFETPPKTGVWKIAHADFMTALMAFFLVLWLVSQQSPSKRQGIAQFFNPIKLSETSLQKQGIESTVEPRIGVPDQENDIMTMGGPLEDGAIAGASVESGPEEVSITNLITPQFSEAEIFTDPYGILNQLVAPVSDSTEDSEGSRIGSSSGVGLSGGTARRDPFDPTYWQLRTVELSFEYSEDESESRVPGEFDVTAAANGEGANADAAGESGSGNLEGDESSDALLVTESARTLLFADGDSTYENLLNGSVQEDDRSTDILDLFGIFERELVADTSFQRSPTDMTLNVEDEEALENTYRIPSGGQELEGEAAGLDFLGSEKDFIDLPGGGGVADVASGDGTVRAIGEFPGNAEDSSGGDGIVFSTGEGATVGDLSGNADFLSGGDQFSGDALAGSGEAGENSGGTAIGDGEAANEESDSVVIAVVEQGAVVETELTAIEGADLPVVEITHLLAGGQQEGEFPGFAEALEEVLSSDSFGQSVEPLEPGEALAQRIRTAMAQLDRRNAEEFSLGRVSVDVVDGGVAINLTDSADFGMFAIGSSEPLPQTIQLMEELAATLTETGGRVTIGGHTDARPFVGEGNDNWRLSTSRAHVARFMLIRGGLAEARIVKIEGYADRQLYNPDDPFDAANRRIEILVDLNG